LKKLLLLLTIVLFPTLADAQSTSVTLQVTDAGSQSWNNGSYTVVLKSQQGATNFGPPFNLVGGGGTVPNQTQSGALSATGGASFTLTPNASVLPSQSGWQFSVCPQQGIPTQCFVQAVTVFGASQTVTLVPPTISVNCGPGVNAYADTEVNCSIGGQYYNVTTPSQRQCTASTGTVCNTWTAAGGSSSPFSKNLIDVTQAPYNVIPGFTIPDATFTNGQNTISCPNNDCNFTTAMNGWICYGTNFTVDTSIISTPSVMVLPQGTFTFVSAQLGTCSGGNATATVTAAGVLVIGPDATSGLTAAWNVAILNCGIVQLPGGIMPVQSALFNTNSTGDKCILDLGSGYGAYGVRSFGITGLLAPTPNFNAASCTGTTSADGCFFGATAIFTENLGIFGAGQGAIGAGFNGKAAVHYSGSDALNNGSNQYIYNVLFNAWGATTAGFTGVSMTGNSGILAVGLHNDGVGSTGCNVVPPAFGAIYMFNVFCAVNNVKSLFVGCPAAGCGQVWSYGGIYGFGTGTNQAAVEVFNNGFPGPLTFFSFGDFVPYNSGTGGVEVQCHGTDASHIAVCHLSGDYLLNSTTGATTISAGSFANVYIENSSVLNNGGGTAAAIVGGLNPSKIYDLGGNTISSASSKAVNLVSFGGTFFSNPTSTYVGTITDIAPTCPTVTGATATCAAVAGSTNEKGTLRITVTAAGTAAGTVTMNFSGQAYTGSSGTTPACNFSPALTGTGAWNARATMMLSTRSSTAPIITWDNNAAALGNLAWDIDYVCVAR
jgi:hypothetical protein